MKYLFFDTETTGLPRKFKASYKETENWPRIVQLSWIVANESGVLEKESDNIIKVYEPIPESASRVHGITNEISLSKGEDLSVVLNKFLLDVETVETLVCHNLNFDMPVLQSELFRLGLNPELRKKKFCTMLATVDYCKLEGPYGYKWPKLEELYRHCFNKDFENAHNAFADVKATYEVFYKLKEEAVF